MKCFGFGVICLLLLAGAGCASSSLSEQRRVMLPEIFVERPVNGFVTTSSTVELTGRTNMPDVVINQQRYPVVDGRFSVNVNLIPGTHSFEFIVANGLTTTTLQRTITRQ